MTYTIRVPLDQYAYIEVPFEGTSDEAMGEYRRLVSLYKGGEGLLPKEFDTFLDKYLTDNTGNLDMYTKMSVEQQNIIQCIKRSIKRIDYKNK